MTRLALAGKCVGLAPDAGFSAAKPSRCSNHARAIPPSPVALWVKKSRREKWPLLLNIMAIVLSRTRQLRRPYGENKRRGLFVGSLPQPLHSLGQITEGHYQTYANQCKRNHVAQWLANPQVSAAG